MHSCKQKAFMLREINAIESTMQFANINMIKVEPLFTIFIVSKFIYLISVIMANKIKKAFYLFIVLFRSENKLHPQMFVCKK